MHTHQQTLKHTAKKQHVESKGHEHLRASCIFSRFPWKSHILSVCGVRPLPMLSPHSEQDAVRASPTHLLSPLRSNSRHPGILGLLQGGDPTLVSQQHPSSRFACYDSVVDALTGCLSNSTVCFLEARLMSSDAMAPDVF